MTNDQAQTIADAIESLSVNVAQVAREMDDLGFASETRSHGPGAIEALGIALAGEGLRTPVGASLEAIAVEIRTHSEAVESVAYQLGRIASALEAMTKTKE